MQPEHVHRQAKIEHLVFWAALYCRSSVQRVRDSEWRLSYRAAASGTSLYCWAQPDSVRRGKQKS
eukprot:2837523-Rhodomonas_salina.1